MVATRTVYCSATHVRRSIEIKQTAIQQVEQLVVPDQGARRSHPTQPYSARLAFALRTVNAPSVQVDRLRRPPRQYCSGTGIPSNVQLPCLYDN